MANEITVMASLSVSNSGYDDSRNIRRLLVDQENIEGISGVQVVPTNYMQLKKGSVTDNGYVFIRNLDDENFVQIGIEVASAFEPFAKLMPGEVILMRASQDLYVQADTANILIDYLLLGE